VRTVAREVGPTVPALYYHFENTQAMLVSLLDHATSALVHSARDILDDEPFQANGTIAVTEHEHLGQVRMPNVLFRLSETPGSVDWLGRDLGQDTEEVMRACGVSEQLIASVTRANHFSLSRRSEGAQHPDPLHRLHAASGRTEEQIGGLQVRVRRFDVGGVGVPTWSAGLRPRSGSGSGRWWGT
jgi:AcrR family transcriptional regulator